MEDFVNWRRYPFVKLIIPFALGIIAADRFLIFNNLSSVWAVFGILVVGIISGKIVRTPKLTFLDGIYFFILFFMLGLSSFRLHEPDLSPLYFKNFISQQETTALVRADDIDVTENWFKVYGTVTQVRDSQEHWHHTRGKLLLYASRNKGKIEPGNMILFRSRFSPVPDGKNPYAFDYKTFLKRKYINYQSFAREGDWLLTGEKTKTLAIHAALFRLKLIEILKKYIPSEREYSVAAALILGYRNDVSDELSNAYINTGSIHILAVSGLHVGLVSGVIMLLLSFISKNNLGFRIVKLSLILAGIWFFVLITGAGASVIRAAVMFSFIHAGQVFLRRKYIYNTIAASAFIIFIYNPQLLFDVGFHLSMVAVLGIISIQPLLKSFWNPSSKALNFFWELSTVTIAAQIATLPITLYYFHQTSMYFLLSGIFIVPISSVALYAGIGVFVFNFIIPALAKFSALVMYGSLFVMNSGIYGILRLPFNLITNIPFNEWEFLILSLGIVFLVIALTLRRKKLLFGSLFCFLIFAVLRLVINWQHASQEMVIFYNSKEKVFIDFFKGTRCVAVRESSDELSEKYVASGARMHYRIQKVNSYIYGSDIPGIYSVRSELMNLPNLKIQFLRKKDKEFCGIKTPYCVYVVDDILPDDCMIQSLPEKVFLGSSTKYYTKKRWAEFCEKNHLEFIDLKLKSYTINLAKHG